MIFLLAIIVTEIMTDCCYVVCSTMGIRVVRYIHKSLTVQLWGVKAAPRPGRVSLDLNLVEHGAHHGFTLS